MDYFRDGWDKVKSLYYEKKTLSVKNICKPVSSIGETIIRVRLGGICRTDIEICGGYMAFTGVLGHEFVGVAIEGSNKGQRVVGEINAGCGACNWCLRGLQRHCPNRSVLGIAGRNGAFSEYCLIPDKNLYPVPEEVSDEEAIFTEPLAAALEIREQIIVPPALPVAVVGDGRLAYLIAQVMRLTGNPVVIFGKYPNKLNRFKDIQFEVGDSGEEADARLFPIVVECSGNPSGLNKAMELLEPRGTLILKSTYRENPAINLADIVIREWTILGSRCGQFKPALDLLRRKMIDTASLITDRFPLGEGIEAMTCASRPDAGKVVLEIGG